MADDYLAYWFRVLRDDADPIEGGQGSAVQRRTAGRWQAHVAQVFESAARDHARRLVAAEEGSLTVRDLGDLRRRAAHLPEPALMYAFRSRGGADAALAGHPEVRRSRPPTWSTGNSVSVRPLRA